MPEVSVDHIDVANKKFLDQFVKDYLPSNTQWRSWAHPVTKAELSINLFTAPALPEADFEACFQLISTTSSADYKRSKAGWKPTSKRKEMKLRDLKYFIVKANDEVQGFASFMPTYEDDYPVIYCYEIHLSPALQSTGLGRLLMGYVEAIGAKIPSTSKTMLTCFTSNEGGLKFYHKLGYTKDEYSPAPKQLRNGTKVEAEYVILSKPVNHP